MDWHTIGIIYNERVAEAQPLAEEIAAWLTERGRSVWQRTRSTFIRHPLPADLLLTLGGDGSILRAVGYAAPHGIPLLGINLGRVGFLTETPPQQWREVLTQALDGAGHIEERTMLRVTLLRAGRPITRQDALNDAVIGRGNVARAVHLAVTIGKIPFTTYVCDGVILATATGSTAYAYAVGGPVLPPWLDNLILVPTAAHLSFDRPLVLHPSSVIEITYRETIPGLLTVDGFPVSRLEQGDMVQVTRSPYHAKFLRLRPSAEFYRTLVPRLYAHITE